MKKNGQFLLMLMLMALPCCFIACSDKDDETPEPEVPEEPVTPETPEKTAIAFNIPDFTDSYVYLVMDGDQKLAEICNEYIANFSKEKRATVVYLFDKDGKIDYTKGFVADNGGSVSWSDDSYWCEYKAGTLSGLKTLYVDSNRIVTTAEPLKTLTATADKFKDADNNEYKIVKIGKQYWLGENMRSTKWGDGTSIANDLTGRDWHNDTAEEYLIYFDEYDETLGTPESIKANYGLLYNWKAANKLASSGWHLPSMDEWYDLDDYLYGEDFDEDEDYDEEWLPGSMLKEVGSVRWSEDNEIANNITGFTAVGAGTSYPGFFSFGGSDTYTLSCTDIRNQGNWWTSTKSTNSLSDAVIMYISACDVYLDDWEAPKNEGYSVRLIRD